MLAPAIEIRDKRGRLLKQMHHIMNNPIETTPTQTEKKQWNEPTVTQLSISLDTMIGLGAAADGLNTNT